MVSGTLYAIHGSFKANKIQIAAAYGGSDVKVASNFEYGKTNIEESFLKKFPLGKVPAFEDSNGNCLDGTNTIARYVSNEALIGGNALDQAKVVHYIEFADSEILPSACTWTFPTLGFKQYNKQDTENAIAQIKKCLAVLNNELLTKTFLVGERVTLADISLCCNLVILYVQVLDQKFREPYGNVNRWFMTCVNQPNFKKVLGEVKLCEKMATFDNKRYQELHPKAPKKGAEKKPEQKPKEKKTEVPTRAPEPEKPKHKKPADYFVGVPESNFVMDVWKKKFQNADGTEYEDWFWENFDKNAYSLWYGEYTEELKEKIMLANNLAGGMSTRLDSLRKYAFGVFNIYEKEPQKIEKYSIRCVFLFYGTEYVFSKNDDWNVDAESFKFRQLFSDNEDDRRLFNFILAGEAEEVKTYKVFV